MNVLSSVLSLSGEHNSITSFTDWPSSWYVIWVKGRRSGRIDRRRVEGSDKKYCFPATATIIQVILPSNLFLTPFLTSSNPLFGYFLTTIIHITLAFMPSLEMAALWPTLWQGAFGGLGLSIGIAAILIMKQCVLCPVSPCFDKH